MPRTAGAALALLSFLLFAPAVASAQKASLSERIDAYSVILQRYQQQPYAAEMSDEIGLMRSWITEAQGLAARDKDEAAERVLERVQAQSELIDALGGRAEAVTSQKQTAARVQGLQRDLMKVREEVTRLEQRRNDLQREGT
jgi:hypothetical protein